MHILRWIVLEQALWVALAGMLLAAVMGAGLLALARAEDVPVVLQLWVTLSCVIVALGIAVVSGLAAVQSLKRADPATLLR
jgi:putative ABC transport system permease protein